MCCRHTSCRFPASDDIFKSANHASLKLTFTGMRSGEFHTLNDVRAAMDPSKLLWGRVKSSSDNREIYTTSQLDWMNVELFLLLFHSLTTYDKQLCSTSRFHFFSPNTRFLSCSHFSDNTIFLKAFFLSFFSSSSWARFASRATLSCWSPRRCSCRLYEFSSYFQCHFSEWFRSESFASGTLCAVCMRNFIEFT